MVDLNHVSYHWIRGYGPEHVLWERSLPSDWHHGEEAEGAHINLGDGFKKKKSFKAGKGRNPHFCLFVCVCAPLSGLTGCWLHGLGGGCGGEETGTNQS